MEAKHLWHGSVAFVFIAAGLGIVAGVAYLLYGAPSLAVNSKSATSTSQVAKATVSWPAVQGGFNFACDKGKTVQAVFSNSSVKLMLSDGREITLPQTVSGSGARYANTDESFVFWNKGDTAFIQENGAKTYSGCATTQTKP